MHTGFYAELDTGRDTPDATASIGRAGANFMLIASERASGEQAKSRRIRWWRKMSEGVRESGEVPESVINALRISRHAAYSYTAKGEDAMYSNTS